MVDFQTSDDGLLILIDSRGEWEHITRLLIENIGQLPLIDSFEIESCFLKKWYDKLFANGVGFISIHDL